MSGRRLLAIGSAAFGMGAARLQAQDVRTADSLLRQGILQRAEAEYYAASRIHPRDPNARFALGKYLLDRGAFRIGATLIDEAMQFGYDKSAGSAVLARVYMNLGEYAAMERLPASTLASDEAAQLRWLAAHPSHVTATDSSVLVAFMRPSVDQYVGAVRLRVNGQPVVASISSRSSCGLRISDTSAVARTLHRFPSASPSAERTLGAADSIAFGRMSISNIPVAVERFLDQTQAVVCFGMLARLAPTFDPRANLMTIHLAGVAPPPMSTSVVTPILDIDGQYTILRGGKWIPLASTDAAALVRDRRWTFDPRRRQITIDP
jgi:tetratricopeptide (TPR) repeat protein